MATSRHDGAFYAEVIWLNHLIKPYEVMLYQWNASWERGAYLDSKSCWTLRGAQRWANRKLRRWHDREDKSTLEAEMG